MDGMPPPPPRQVGKSGDRGLFRAALHNASKGSAGLTSPPISGAPAAATPLKPGAATAALALPLPWDSYFDQQLTVDCPSRRATLNVYQAGSSGPVVLCLHGGGYTGLSWALFAQHLKGRCRVIAPDLRGHGLSTSSDDSDLSADTLAADVAALWVSLFGQGSSPSGDGPAAAAAAAAEAAAEAAEAGAGADTSPSDGSGDGPAADTPRLAAGAACSAGVAGTSETEAVGTAGEATRPSAAPDAAAPPATPPPTVLVGHSMGGAIAVHAAALNAIPSLEGVVVIDVVEGTAISSLPFMESVLRGRPLRFESLRQAADWALATGMCRREEAAHISLPSMLRQQGAGASSAGAAAAAQPAVGVDGAAVATQGGPAEVPGEQQYSGSSGGGGGGAEDMGLRWAPSFGVLGPLREDEEEAGARETTQAADAAANSSTLGVDLAATAAAAAAEPAATSAAASPPGHPLPLGSGAAALPSVPSADRSAGGDAAAGSESRRGLGRGSRRDGSTEAAALREGSWAGRQQGAGSGWWVWRTALQQSSKYWEGWFRGLSDKFLSLKVPKVLVLAGTDRLDRQLTIGQMQGRFQLVLLPQAGHAVHEDEPERTAQAVDAFLHRFRVGEPPLQLPRAALGLAPVLPIPAGPTL
ncbi:hypothetical protein N2152v2_000370 [Parachlorella kessleri]